MKILLTAVVALALTAPAFAQAQSMGQGDHAHAKALPVWRRGQHMPREYADRRYYLDPAAHHLRAPPAGYEWRLVGDHAYLVRVDTGLVTAAVTALFPR
jgi:Ni/Co efflux regulator RcnB